MCFLIIYICCISVILLLNSLAFNKPQLAKNSFGYTYCKPNVFLFCMSICVILFLFAFRGWTGTDTGTYISSYRNMYRVSLLSIYKNSHDWLFYAVQWINYKLFSGSLICNNIVIGLITYLPVLIMYIKYSGNYKLAFIFYVLTSNFFFQFNGQRQAVAMAIVFAAYPLLIHKKYIPFFLLTLLAYNFHSTAIIMIPISFLLTKKTSSKLFIITSFVLLFSAIFIWQLWDDLFELLGVMGQDRLVNEYSGITAEDAPGANILRLLVYSAPCIVGIIYYKPLCKKLQNYDFLLNNAILGSIFMLAATKTWYFARLTTYFAYTTPILLIQISSVFNKRSKKIYYLSLILLFTLYMYFYLNMDSNLLPYNFNFKRSFY